MLVSMLQQEKIHPLLAFSHCGLFSDAESAYTMSMNYYEEQQAKEVQKQQSIENGGVGNDGQGVSRSSE